MGSFTLATTSAAAQAGDGRRPRDTAVIHVFMGGGPSHIDLYDLEARGAGRNSRRVSARSRPACRACRSASTCRTWPRAHAPRGAGPLGGARQCQPSAGLALDDDRLSAAAVDDDQRESLLPARSSSNCAGRTSRACRPTSAFRGGSCWAAAAYLGPAYNPFTIESDPNSPTYAVRNLNFPERDGRACAWKIARALLRELDRLRRDGDRRPRLAGLDKFSREALEMVTSSRAQQAFDLSREADRHARSLRPHVRRAGRAAGPAAGRSRA